MLTIREIKERTETFFIEKGVPNAKLDTDILIAHSLGIKRLDIYLDLDRPLHPAPRPDTGSQNRKSRWSPACGSRSVWVLVPGSSARAME